MLARDPLDVGATGRQFIFQLIKATIEVIDAINRRLTFSNQALNSRVESHGVMLLLDPCIKNLIADSIN
ncbi:MAG: hypothetical protein ABJ034_11505 [Hyphomicrobiales bacterium]